MKNPIQPLVCGNKLGPVVGPMRNATCAVVQDPGGAEHRTHHKCAGDADGKVIRTEPVAPAPTPKEPTP